MTVNITTLSVSWITDPIRLLNHGLWTRVGKNGQLRASINRPRQARLTDLLDPQRSWNWQILNAGISVVSFDMFSWRILTKLIACFVWLSAGSPSCYCLKRGAVRCMPTDSPRTPRSEQIHQQSVLSREKVNKKRGKGNRSAITTPADKASQQNFLEAVV